MPTGIYTRIKPSWNKGKHLLALSMEHKKNISESLLGKRKTKEHAQHIGDSRRGVPRTAQCIEKIKAASIGQRRSPRTEFKKGLIPWNKGMVGFMGGEKNGHWKGGKSKDGYGYVLIEHKTHPYARNGYVYEHRLVVEKIIGRNLSPWEEVHHRDKIKSHNDPVNLIAFVAKKWHVLFEKGFGVSADKIIFDGRRYALSSLQQ